LLKNVGVTISSALTCDLKAASLQYLVAIEIKAIAATKRNPGAQYARRVGVGEFVAC
jgi:hypothetical protein